MSAGVAHYLDVASRFQAAAASSDPAWVKRFRQEGLAHFERQGLPTTKDEAWKYTNVAHIAERAFAPAGDGITTTGLVASKATGLALPGPRLVFVAGRLVPALSSVGDLPRGLTLRPLRDALREEGEALEALLGQRARSEAHPFTALNAALLGEGALLRVAPGTRGEVPVQLIFLMGGADDVLASPRIVVDVGTGGQVTLVEMYASAGGASGARPSFTNAVTEVTLGDGASFHHYKFQDEGKTAPLHLGGLHVRQGRDSRFSSHVFSFGGSLARNEVHVAFAGEGGEATLKGLYVGLGSQHLDHLTELDHAVPHCSSNELYKGILDGHSRGTFHGVVRVRQDAQRTDARQQNRNLLLSEHAQADARPQLEILADDVKCAHGAAVGRLDEQAMFYLRSRGISPSDAQRLLTQAFAREVVDTVPAGPLRERVEGLLNPRFPSMEPDGRGWR